jgi:hypothetical protein
MESLDWRAVTRLEHEIQPVNCRINRFFESVHHFIGKLIQQTYRSKKMSLFEIFSVNFFNRIGGMRLFISPIKQ